MIFTQKTIAPAGRNKYGRYYAAGNITKSVVSTTYAGNNTTTTIQEPNKPEEEVDDKGFYCILSKASTTFDALDLVEGTSDSTMVVAYRGYDKAPVYVCDMDLVTTTESDGIITSITAPPNMGIQNIPSGITVAISNNGTTGSTITFYADSDLTGTTGTIRIPAVIYKRSEAVPGADDLLDWYNSKAWCEQVWLDFTWTVNRNGSSTYVLDLSNERAGVNCDSAGTIYSASTAALTCTASTYYGTEVVASATYTISIQPRYNAVGVSIAQATGVLQWASNFSFTGPNLPIDVISWVDGVAVAVKTMNIEKNYPGADGSPAVTRWIVTDYDVVKYNPNTNQLDPAIVQAWVMKQVGGDEPVSDTGETIYYGYDTTTPTQVLPASGAAAYSNVSSITFALKTSQGVYYEVETVPIISDGTNGSDGSSGQSAWNLSLTNDNASINCDSDGNILSGAVRPTCQAKLYYGQTQQTSATYSVNYGGASGVTSSVTSGVLTLTFGSNFNFTGTSVNITISGKTQSIVRDVKVMTISKSIAGADGEDAVSYWLEVSYPEVIYNPNTSSRTPTSLTCAVKKQVGQGAIENATDAVVKYMWQKRSDSSWTSETTYSSSVSVTASNCQNYFRLRFTAYVNSVAVDQEDVEIITDGTNGSDGSDGENAWNLTLSNDNASINCDSNGNILSGAVRPTCQAKLYYGMTKLTTGVSYNVDYGGASGVTTSTTSGTLTLTFGNNFNFTASTVSITISASTESVLRDVKIMNISKAIAGAPGQNGEDGEDAISYWLEPNYGEVIYNPNTKSVSPTAITCSAYKQIGQQAVLPASEATIKYKWQYRSNNSFTTESTIPSTGVTVTSGNCVSYCRLRLVLYVNNAQYDQEDIDILMDGTNGTDGSQGRAGAAIRGPYDYASHSGSSRCWCAGSSSSTCSECEKWIDVIIKDGVYYYCNTNYYGTIAGGLNHSPSYWTSGDTFDFIATNLLLANNASINFLTGNELYLRNSNNEITAGAAGGNGINFWAGSDTPGNAPFKVNNDGSMVATKGSFGPFTIGNDAYGHSALNASGTSTSEDYTYTDNMTMNSYSLTMTGEEKKSTSASTNTLSIVTSKSDAASDLQNAVIQLDMGKYPNTSPSCTPYDRLAMQTNANISAGRFVGKRGCAVTSALYDIQVIYTTSASTQFYKSPYWHIGGIQTNIPYTQPVGLFKREGNRWYYGKEDLGITTTASTVYLTSGSTNSRKTWTFNGSDLGIEATAYPNMIYNSTYNCWCANNGSGNIPTGIEHSTSGIATPNAIYINVPTGTSISTATIGLAGYQSSATCGNYKEIYCELGSSSGSGYVVLSLSSQGTMSDVTTYSSASWLTVQRSGSVSTTVTINVAANNAVGTRWGYVEFYSKRNFGLRVVYMQTAE